MFAANDFLTLNPSIEAAGKFYAPASREVSARLNVVKVNKLYKNTKPLRLSIVLTVAREKRSEGEEI